MKGQLFNWVIHVWDVVLSNSHWMSWNLFLALVPFILSSCLFRFWRSRSWLWWLGFLVFVAFLPNAPYVLTDIIHLIEDIRHYQSVWIITLVLVPQYLLFMIVGFGAYVLSLMNLGYYLQTLGWRRYIVPVELFVHFLSAIGIYLGRFKRFNSWDIVTKLDTLTATILDDLVGKWPLLVIAITFVVLTVLYWLTKQVTLGIILRFRSTTSAVSSL